MDKELGTLESVDLRKVWLNEAQDFTPWLAKNIDRLGDAVGINMEVIETESAVGGFSADIYAIDSDTNQAIIIENQLEDTNHTHLGQIITYASGKDASLVIWVVKRARDEHRSAIEWLNSHTDDGIGFFLCEVKVYKIGDSKEAPYFEVIERPNNWTKSVKQASGKPKTVLPKIGDMLGWGVVKAGDILYASGYPEEESILQANGKVLVGEDEMSINKWLLGVTGWETVQSYMYAVHKESGKTLSEIWREYMDKYKRE